MMDHNREFGTFLRVDQTDGGFFTLQPHDESVVRKAVQDYREKRIDSLIEAEHRFGYPVYFIASSVISLYLSTPESREASVLEEIRQDEWEEEFRKRNRAKAWDD